MSIYRKRKRETCINSVIESNATYCTREPNLRTSAQLDIKFPSSINVIIFLKLILGVSSIVVTILKETESTLTDGNMDIHC